MNELISLKGQDILLRNKKIPSPYLARDCAIASVAYRYGTNISRSNLRKAITTAYLIAGRTPPNKVMFDSCWNYLKFLRIGS
jgi:hypothetical protein